MTPHDQLLSLFSARRGHFQFESGHHGDLWLDLELLCLRPDSLQPYVRELAERIARYDVHAVCGPLVEGAFVALMVASQLRLDFLYTEHGAEPSSEGLYPVTYQLPGALRTRVRHKRIAIVNDVVNAGSAVRGTAKDLKACGAEVAVVGALLVLGTSASEFANSEGIGLESIGTLPNVLWTPSDCPQCASGVPLDRTLRS